ncbi:MAG: hypothetical protein QM756_07510 [Polyangiaceae bacterium]
MSNLRTWFVALVVPPLAVLSSTSCSTSSESTRPIISSQGGGSSTTSGGSSSVSNGGSTSSTGQGGSSVIVGTAGAATIPTDCQVSCTPLGGQYCGEIGDKCGNKVSCGNCSGDWVCQEGLCVGGPSCQKGTCTVGATKFCGSVGDNCGGALACGDCPSGQTCNGGMCVPTNCTPLTCASMGWNYCGTIGDGCGGTLTCGDCPNGGVCGSAVAHVCGASADCKKISCDTTGGGRYCGTVGDGCQGALDCGACPSGQSCKNSICLKDNCVALTSCTNGTTRFCGTIGDGCNGSLTCPACAGGEVCGTTAHPNVCLPANCVPGTCTAPGGGQYCGTIGDGCGGSVTCSTPCPNNGVCGAETANVCPGTGPSGCSGLACQVDKCSGSATTSISGTVYDPAGKNPLYNVVVYVPNAALDPIPTGASCDKCGAIASGKPITTALTDVKGHFVLKGVPTGTNIPLVMQVGKWRRQVTIPKTTSCADTAVADPTDANQKLLRLPRTQTEGNIPRIAMATGGSDATECLLRRVGIADSEFTTDSGSGRVHMFAAGNPNGDHQGTNSFSSGAKFPVATTLWGTTAKLMNYDMVLLSCEGSGSDLLEFKTPYMPNMLAYLNGGGRVFFDHMHYLWLRNTPALAATGAYVSPSKLPADGIIATIDTSFPKGTALSQWLVNTGASTTAGQINILQGQHSLTSVTASAQRWIYVANDPGTSTPAVQYMTFNTPVGAAADAQCGRGVFTDLHINVSYPDGSGGDNSDPVEAVPDRVQRQADVALGQGARVHLLRPVIVRAARHDDAGAANASAASARLGHAARAASRRAAPRRAAAPERDASASASTAAPASAAPSAAGALSLTNVRRAPGPSPGAQSPSPKSA